MNSLQALQDEALLLPKSYESSVTFLKFIKQSFDAYLSVLDKIDEGTIVDKLKVEKHKAQTLCYNLLESYHQLYLGFVSSSYSYFDLALKEIQPFLFNHGAEHPLNDTRVLFRGRKSESALDRSQMFHLPFELRHLATTQRFSIPGLPTLYLGNSAYVCWEELNRPEHKDFYVSRFEVKDYTKLRILDISLTPQKITKMITTTIEFGGIDSWDKLILDYLMKWPIIFCCSIKVLYEYATFKPEYIMPQYLLQWVRENRRLNSIKYFSVKTHLTQDIDHSSFVNLVIPVQEISDTGHCKHLVESFLYTNPRCLADIDDTIPIPQPDIENYIMNYRHDTILLSDLKDFDKDYLHSKFGRLEVLECLETAK